MAELDLANALAQQAAGGRRRGGAMAAASNAATPGAKTAWQPLKLGRDFSISDATATALTRAALSMNKSLRPEGLVVNVPQGSENMPVEVAEARGGKVVKAYDGPEFLSMFAHQRQMNGVIVDGQA